MAESIWEDDSLTVVLLPSGEQGSSLLRLAERWTELAFLGPALWVRPEDVQTRPGTPPVILAAVFGRTRDGEPASVRHDLFELLARQSLRMVRLLTVRSVDPDRELDELQDEITETVATWLRNSVPHEVSSSTLARQRNDLVRIDLVCAPTEYELRQRVAWVAR